MAPAGRLFRPLLLARRWSAAAASSSTDSSSMIARLAASTSTAATTTPTTSSLRPHPKLHFSRSFASLSSSSSFEEDVGQPTHETHPELLAPGELAPGVTPSEISSRRDALAERMEAHFTATSTTSYFPRTSNSTFTRNSTTRGGLNLAVLPSPLPVVMAGVIPYPYRPDPDFYYLTGVAQPGCVAVVVAEEEEGGEEESVSVGRIRRAETSKKRHRFILFVPDECPRARLWDGGRLSVEAAKRVFGADDAFPMSHLHSRLSPLLSAASLVLCDADRSAGADPRYASLAEVVLSKRTGVQPLRPHSHTLRWVKSDAELGLMRRSAQMAAAGMRAAMSASNLRGSRCGGGGGGGGGGVGASVSERVLAAAFEHRVKSSGADRLAYPPVVAGGPRACTIHYSRNDRRLRRGDWLLMDAGCEFWGYASDVSRAWPVVDSGPSAFSSSSSPSLASGGNNDSFSSSASALFSSGPHSDVYYALLEVHAKCVAAAVPGNSLSEIHALSVSLLTDALSHLGGAAARAPRSAVPALRGLSAAAIAGRGGQQGPLTGSDIYPHAIGHWLGLDTHDAPLGFHGAGAPLVENVVLTIEPGLYFPPDERRWGRLAGIGMRLEDDVAVRRIEGSGGSGGSGEGGRGGGEAREEVRGSGPEVLSAGAPLLPEEVAAAIDGN